MEGLWHQKQVSRTYMNNCIPQNIVVIIHPCPRHFPLVPKSSYIHYIALSISHGHSILQNKWWRHQMEISPRCWSFVWGIQWSPMNSPHKGQWRGAFVFSLICAWTNRWVNNRAGYLIRHCAHYDVTIMKQNKHPIACPWASYGSVFSECKLQPTYRLSRCDSVGNIGLSTHLDQDKMAANFADDVLNHIFLIENVWISIKISLKSVPDCFAVDFE